MKIKSLILGGVFIDAYNQSVNVDIAGTITTGVDASNMKFVTENNMEEAKVEQIGNLYPDKDGFKNRTCGRVYSSDGLSPTLRTVTGGHNEPKIVEPIVLGWVRDKQGNVIKRPEVEVANCVTSGKRDNTQNYVVETQEVKYRIRKLTPRECFRLMDCDDEVIDKIQEAGISNSQQYKMAGNSIVVNELYHLFRKLFTETENEENQLTLF
jgi:site-specific DNA-cytosine methylase